MRSRVKPSRDRLAANLQPCHASMRGLSTGARADSLGDPKPQDAGATPIPDFDAIIIGAGMSGLYQLYRLRELGLRVRVFEAGTDVGGTWYWNRYPGARFDSESYSYGYSFSQGAAGGMGLVRAFRRPAGDAALSQPRRRQVRPAPRHPVPQPGDRGASTTRSTRSWSITLEDGSRFRARFLITAIGPLSAPTLPRIEGVDDFKGAVLPHRALAEGAGGLRGQARRRDRHRRDRRADHPDHRRPGRPSHRVPAHAELVRAAAQRQDRRRDAGEDQGRLSRDLRALPGDLCLLPPHAGPARRVRGDATRSARRSARSSTASPASASGWAISATS